jgi:hyaluronoglucosaminidase
VKAARWARKAILGLVVGSLFVSPLAGVASVAAAAGTASPFAWRGVVEGFYGTPYSQADRLSLISWEGSHGMNLYIHAPKGDLYAGAYWSRLYPAGAMNQFAQEIELANTLGVSWVPDVDPGAPVYAYTGIPGPYHDICFSCSADRQLLLTKLQSFVSLGVKAVMISFDDDQMSSSHTQDARTYGTGPSAYGLMTAKLLDWVAAELPGITIFTVPPDYQGTTSTPYLSSFATHLNPGIVVLWTGPVVISPTITRADATDIDSVLKRKVVVWDNTPVNDFSKGHDLFLGPITNLGPGLAGVTSGVVANPSIWWQPSIVPLDTLADDLSDPTTYSAQTSWEEALTSFGGVDAPSLSVLAQSLDSSPMLQPASPVFEPLATAFLSASTSGTWAVPASELAQELSSEESASATLAKATWNPEFSADASPFISKLGLNAATGAAALSLVEAERPALSASASTLAGVTTVSGSATAPSVPGAEKLVSQLDAKDGALAANHYNVGGVWSASGGWSPVGNVVASFISAAAHLSAIWFWVLHGAADTVTVKVNGKTVVSKATGREAFSVKVSRPGPVSVLATDAIGMETAITLPGS